MDATLTGAKVRRSALQSFLKHCEKRGSGCRRPLPESKREKSHSPLARLAKRRKTRKKKRRLGASYGRKKSSSLTEGKSSSQRKKGGAPSSSRTISAEGRRGVLPLKIEEKKNKGPAKKKCSGKEKKRNVRKKPVYFSFRLMKSRLRSKRSKKKTLREGKGEKAALRVIFARGGGKKRRKNPRWRCLHARKEGP